MEYEVRLRLDAAHRVQALSVTAWVDEAKSYRVVPEYGPFDTWAEVLDAVQRGLDRQMTLW